MTGELVILLMTGLLIFGLTIGHPLAFVLGGTAVITAFFVGRPQAFGLIVNRIYGDVLTNYTLIAIPLFILMARFLTDSGVTDKLFSTLQVLMSRVSGGLALAVVVIAILLAATTGIVGASITVIGLMALKPMINAGYSNSVSCGIIAASGCLGILIPPSIMLVLMASYSPLSVGQLFAGALVPGLILGMLYILFIVFLSWLRPDLVPPTKIQTEYTNQQLIKLLLIEALPPILLIVVVIGSLIFGVATATEASALGTIIALVLVVIRGKFSLKLLQSALTETGLTTAMILFIVIGATAFTGVFNITGGLAASQNLVRGLNMEPWQLIFVIMVFVFVLGMFLDWTGIVLLSFPIFLPIVNELNIDLLWFVILMSVVLQTSFLSPPFGYALFYLRAIAPKEVATTQIIIGVLPYIAIIILVCLVIAVFPSLVNWLPQKIYSLT